MNMEQLSIQIDNYKIEQQAKIGPAKTYIFLRGGRRIAVVVIRKSFYNQEKQLDILRT